MELKAYEEAASNFAERLRDAMIPHRLIAIPEEYCAVELPWMNQLIYFDENTEVEMLHAINYKDFYDSYSDGMPSRWLEMLFVEPDEAFKIISMKWFDADAETRKQWIQEMIAEDEARDAASDDE